MKTEFKIGDIVEGEVTGIQNYGIFVSLSDTEQGLVHISECKHGYMTELSDYIKIGDRVKVMVIDIDEYTHKISLSMRVLVKLNTPPFPARPKKRRKRYLPNIGFASVDKKMPEWIANALEAIDQDKYEKRKKFKTETDKGAN
ncbi:CvfD/Ygs/GSP13 family RNA-binding post-transcriptional regulator [Aerococcaceae bacterium NML160702]|nr:CvfD/Ygs/GSP13 family RNA-binding post-transcriptional regulator [Aerococcaceae bacterium NML180378]MCW6681270.1 CvfD/Ygs/GSP13 family RNA-binding post-transcriptional regulator [Aerococcaceae bacterium NML160702]MDO4775238.1 CvfD/Ygs/GSP13 family RNA-binding post-transcriptional regulator [Aerococcaceae bacterium]